MSAKVSSIARRFEQFCWSRFLLHMRSVYIDFRMRLPFVILLNRNRNRESTGAVAKRNVSKSDFVQFAPDAALHMLPN